MEDYVRGMGPTDGVTAAPAAPEGPSVGYALLRGVGDDAAYLAQHIATRA
jgi:hypothetical protein